MAVTVTPSGAALGAEVSGVDLTRELSPDDVAAIRRAFLEHQVIVIRGQDLGHEDHLRFARLFGDLEVTKTVGRHLAGHPEIMFVANRPYDDTEGVLPDGEMQFHIDQSYYELPIMATTLYSIEIPSTGGNTLFASGYRAYERLPDDVRQRIEGLRALNVYDYDANATVKAKDSRPDAPRWVHPVVRTHPETGRKAVYVSRLMTDHIEDIDEAESRTLLDTLFNAVEQPDGIFEHVWRVGDLVMWDNRCTLHARTDFDPKESRIMRRIAVRGDTPH